MTKSLPHSLQAEVAALRQEHVVALQEAEGRIDDAKKARSDEERFWEEYAAQVCGMAGVMCVHDLIPF